MTPVPDSSTLAELAATFIGFAQHRAGSYAPFTAALATRIAREPELLVAAAAARPGQSRPDLLLACLQLLVIDQRVPDDARQRASQAYARAGTAGEAPPPGAHNDVDAAAAHAPDIEHVVAFALERRDTLAALIASRTVQTNEIGRAAYLYPGLLAAQTHAPGRRLALIEIGASAGLNLVLDRYRLTYVTEAPDFAAVRATGATAATAVTPPPPPVQLPHAAALPTPTVDCVLIGPGRPRLHPALHDLPGLGSRAGLDLHPLDPCSAADRQWLRALVWPEHTARRRRLDQALALAASPGTDWGEQRPPVVAGEAAGGLAELVAAAPADEHPVIMHTAVLAHMTPGDREQFRHAVLEVSRARPISWLSAEPRPDRDPRRLRLALVRGGQVAGERALAAYHPHGATLTWAPDQ